MANKHEVVLTLKEALVAVRDYLLATRTGLPSLDGYIRCSFELDGKAITFKWQSIKDESLDSILGLDK